jgi:hypothetical protein
LRRSATLVLGADPVLQVVVDDEVELLVGEPVVLGQSRVDLVKERLDGLGVELLVADCALLRRDGLLGRVLTQGLDQAACQVSEALGVCALDVLVREEVDVVVVGEPLRGTLSESEISGPSS